MSNKLFGVGIGVVVTIITTWWSFFATGDLTGQP